MAPSTSLEKHVTLGAVALKLLETVWRGGVLVALAIPVGMGMGMGVGVGVDWLGEIKRDRDLQSTLNRDPALSFDGRLRIAVTYPESKCQPNKPIGVEITNLSNDRITQYKWSFAASYEGHSTNLLWGSLEAYFDGDYVIDPRASVGYCHAIPSDLKDRMGGDRIVFSPNSVSTSR